ncbi:thiolase family protein [Nocardia rhamnosiphila]|uniref:thiolase family protein n=1 Tax=Nocardia rhamnosiphila TaxID=426716 RepID=UPI00340A8DE5
MVTPWAPPPLTGRPHCSPEFFGGRRGVACADASCGVEGDLESVADGVVGAGGPAPSRLCGSSLDAAMAAARIVETGDARVVPAGGVESMTRAPWVVPKPSRAYPADDLTAVSTTLGRRLVNPKMPAEWTISLGECNEQLTDTFRISRERQDVFAVRSHQLADAAWRAGHYDTLVISVPGTQLDRDEGIRASSTREKLATLKPSFRPGGTITAGNASPLSDGASTLVIGSEKASDEIGAAPLARIAGRGVHALTPQDFGVAPVEAAEAALTRAGIGWDRVGAVELNEAFAAQSLACIDAWDVDPGIVNTWGGAIALGHPLGASGGRILGTLAHRLVAERKRWGLAALQLLLDVFGGCVSRLQLTELSRRSGVSKISTHLLAQKLFR